MGRNGPSAGMGMDVVCCLDTRARTFTLCSGVGRVLPSAVTAQVLTTDIHPKKKS